MAEPRTTSANPTAVDGIVCPFCAHVRGKEAGGACPKCTMEDTVGTRRSTGERIGPWFVLQRKNPTAPGLRFSVLLTLARRGHVTGKSIVRGPTTGQLWRYAAEVKGLSRLFGVCWHCRASVSPDAATCPRCKSAQEIPDDPDLFLENHAALGLMRDLPALNDDGAAFSEARIGDQPQRTARGPAQPQLPPRVEVRTDGRTDGRADGRADHRLDTPVRPSSPARSQRESNSFHDVEDLTRALTLQRPDGDARPTRRSSGRVTSEPILSASELAAAFQLDGAPAGFIARTRRGVWKLTKILVVLLVVLGIAGAVAAYVKPAWRQVAQEKSKPLATKASAWWAELTARVSGTRNGEDPSNSVAPLDADGHPIASDQLPPPTAIVDARTSEKSVAKADETTPEKPVDKTPAKLASDTSPARPPVNAPLVNASPTSVVDRATATTPKVDPPKVDAPKVDAPKVEPKSEPTVGAKPEVAKVEQPKSELPKPEAPKPDAPKSDAPKSDAPKSTKAMTLDEAIAQATELRNSALDAESRRDWRAAVLIYEQIATLPEDARPMDLKVKMALAKERLEGQ